VILSPPSLPALEIKSRKPFLLLLSGLFLSFAAMLTSSVIAWDAFHGSGTCSTRVSRWFGIFYAVPLVLAVLPSAVLLVLQVGSAQEAPREASSTFTQPSQPPALQAFAQARAATRGDRDLSFLKLTKNNFKQEKRRRRSLLCALAYHVVVILTL